MAGETEKIFPTTKEYEMKEGSWRKCKCGAWFEPDDKDLTLCLDCRLDMSERAGHPRDAFELVTGGVGYRLIKGFNLMKDNDP